MKKIVSLLLALLMILSLAACAAEEKKTETEDAALETKNEAASENEEKKTEEEKEEDKGPVTYTTVTDPLTKADLDAIPIANASMTTDELRQICVDFFDLSMTFTYVPNKDYAYKVESQGLDRTLEEGKLYGGIPYITVGHGNLYRVLDYYDEETGVLNLNSFTDYKMLGNACSGGASWGWGRVVNSITKWQWTWGMTEANGFLKVGPYEYDLTLTTIGKNDGDYGAPEICAKNGKQIMFQSYAAAHKADGIVNTGHVRMVAEEPYVVYKEDGVTIDGEKSYLVCHDQICYNNKVDKYMRTQSDGTTYFIAGGNNWKYTFNELFGTNYIPFTFAEFLGTDPVEPAQVNYAYTDTNTSLMKLAQTELTANYQISDVYLKVKNAAGEEIFSYVRRNESFMKNDFSMTKAIPTVALQKYCDGAHTIELSVQLGNGERLPFYTGTLTSA